MMEFHEEIMYVNGVGLNVASAGSGRPILLLHGFPDTHRVWRKQVDALVAAGFHVIAPDLRGYGKSDAPSGTPAYAIERLREDALGILDALGIERTILVGHDWGSIIGWDLCMHAPERVERFVALSVGHPNAYARAGVSQRLRAWYAALFLVRGVSELLLSGGGLYMLKKEAADSEQFADWQANFARKGRLTAALNYYRANVRLALPGEYPPVRVPVLGVWSASDKALTEAQMADSASYMAAPFRYEKVDGRVGHWLQLQRPAEINRLVLGYAAEVLPA